MIVDVGLGSSFSGRANLEFSAPRYARAAHSVGESSRSKSTLPLIVAVAVAVAVKVHVDA